MSLLAKAKQRKGKFVPTDEDIELALAWTRGEVSAVQMAAAWDCLTKGGKATGSAVYLRLAQSLRAHILEGK